jgi:hypothetical protein
MRSALVVDLEKRRAFWDAEFEVTAGGDEPPAVPLLLAAAPVARWTVSPDSGRIESAAGNPRLIPEGPGVFRASLSGEISGTGEDETVGIRYSLPRLASLPAAFDLTLPEGAVATLEGPGSVTTAQGQRRAGPVLGRVTFDRERPATLLVRVAGHGPNAPLLLGGSLHLVQRLSEDSTRSEVRLQLRVRRGLLESKTVRVPGSLVSVSGPVIVTGPDKEGALTVRFEPPVREKAEVAVTLLTVERRDPAEALFTPVLPALTLGPGDRLERNLTVVAEGGLLMEPSAEQDWEARTNPSDVRSGSDDILLGWRARMEDPRPPRLALRRLKSVAVASALARATLVVFVGESGETRTRLVAEVRSRGRSSLSFRVPPDAVLLGVRSEGLPAAASRPVPDRVEVPIGAGGGRTRVEILIQGRVTPPREGEKLSIPAAVPDEPLERLTWNVVLPPGLTVREQGRRLSSQPEPAAASPIPAGPELTAGERNVVEFAERLAASDLLSAREGAWSPRTDLPAAPLAFTTDLVDVGQGAVPLVLTLAALKEGNPWY